MEPAREHVAAAAAASTTETPVAPLVCNGDGLVTTDGRHFVTALAAQLTRPVRFDLCLDTLRTLGVTAAIELAPGGVLTGLFRRALPDVRTVALRTPDDLAAAHELLADATTSGEAWTEPWQVLVSPAAGTLGRTTDDGATVVRTRDGAVPVHRDPASEVVEWLAVDGDPVGAGQPLARVAPVAR